MPLLTLPAFAEEVLAEGPRKFVWRAVIALPVGLTWGVSMGWVGQCGVPAWLTIPAAFLGAAALTAAVVLWKRA